MLVQVPVMLSAKVYGFSKVIVFSPTEPNSIFKSSMIISGIYRMLTFSLYLNWPSLSFFKIMKLS